ncbi:MAG: hydrogenase expression/formation protein HypE [Planctomycetales bacterium]|nr:hydrogenase expression/formation protein HypE [Planctomycetales bacterium]
MVHDQTDRITLAHGEGRRAMRTLIGKRIAPLLGAADSCALGDAAVLPVIDRPVVMTTDSFVVSPLFFPGGDIGTLAVNGTVNDLAVAGSLPRWISLALIIEEGLPWETLARVLESVGRAARAAGVEVVTGDTKVVPRGAADQLFINTTGVGELIGDAPHGPASLRPGDELVGSGRIGQHGVAVMAVREELGLEPPPVSDCAPLVEAVAALRRAAMPVRAMRDATRGGVATVLHEWAGESGLTLWVDEPRVPISPVVRGTCELLGIEAIHMANEGTMLVAVEAGYGDAAAEALRRVPVSSRASVIGGVVARNSEPVLVRRATGREFPLDEPTGAVLPRIC